VRRSTLLLSAGRAALGIRDCQARDLPFPSRRRELALGRRRARVAAAEEERLPSNHRFSTGLLTALQDFVVASLHFLDGKLLDTRRDLPGVAERITDFSRTVTVKLI
jgi:hypothetical protein